MENTSYQKNWVTTHISGNSGSTTIVIKDCSIQVLNVIFIKIFLINSNIEKKFIRTVNASPAIANIIIYFLWWCHYTFHAIFNQCWYEKLLAVLSRIVQNIFSPFNHKNNQKCLIVWFKHWYSYTWYDKQARKIIHLSCQYWPASVSQTPRKLSFPISMLSKSTALVLFPVFFLLRYSSNFLNTWWGDFLAVVSISNIRNQ